MIRPRTALRDGIAPDAGAEPGSMTDTRRRLTACFTAVFSTLEEPDVVRASVGAVQGMGFAGNDQPDHRHRGGVSDLGSCSGHRPVHIVRAGPAVRRNPLGPSRLMTAFLAAKADPGADPARPG
jgi:hypothetical protein